MIRARSDFPISAFYYGPHPPPRATEAAMVLLRRGAIRPHFACILLLLASPPPGAPLPDFSSWAAQAHNGRPEARLPPAPIQARPPVQRHRLTATGHHPIKQNAAVPSPARETIPLPESGNRLSPQRNTGRTGCESHSPPGAMHRAPSHSGNTTSQREA
jgi:hypothetical protein